MELMSEIQMEFSDKLKTRLNDRIEELKKSISKGISHYKDEPHYLDSLEADFLTLETSIECVLDSFVGKKVIDALFESVGKESK